MGEGYMKLDYEESVSDLDILLKFDFKKTGYLWWRKLVCNCRLIPIAEYGKEKITHKKIKKLEEYIFPYIQNIMILPLTSREEKEGNLVISISSKWEISKIISRFMERVNVKYNKY